MTCTEPKTAGRQAPSKVQPAALPTPLPHPSAATHGIPSTTSAADQPQQWPTLRMGRSCTKVITASLVLPTSAWPSGLFRSEATLDSVALAAMPTEHVSRVSAVTRPRNSAATCTQADVQTLLVGVLRMNTALCYRLEIKEELLCMSVSRLTRPVAGCTVCMQEASSRAQEGTAGFVQQYTVHTHTQT